MGKWPAWGSSSMGGRKELGLSSWLLAEGIATPTWTAIFPLVNRKWDLALAMGNFLGKGRGLLLGCSLALGQGAERGLFPVGATPL